MATNDSVIVTGGAGFIGSHLVDRLIDSGRRVTVVDNLSSGREANVHSGVAGLERMDIRSGEIGPLFTRVKPEAVFHVAAQISVTVSARDPALDAEINVLGSLNVAGAARSAGAKRLVFVSTGGAMYGHPERLPAGEDLPPRPLSPYGASKLAFENYLRVFKHLYGLDYTVVRPANVYGPRQDPHGEAGVVAIFTRAMLAGRPCKIFGDGTDERDFIFVGDVADLLVKALERGGTGPYNAGTGIGTSVNELFATLDALTGYGLKPERLPPRPGDLRRISLDSARARRDLDWAPAVDFKEGLRRTVEWFRRQQPA